jgi:hypothetical protein
MKKLLIAGVVVVVIVAGIGFFALSNLGPLVKKAINTVGPQIAKTDVKVDDVSISVFSGQATIKQFFLGNPNGFKSAQAMQVDSIHLDIDEDSITKDPIIINKIEIISPEITYEKIAGSDNFQTILKNVQGSAKAAGKDGKKSDPSEDKKGKKIIINDVIIKNGKVHLALAALAGKEITAPLPDIHLTDIGKEKNGATAAEAFEKIFVSLYSNISADAVTNIFNDSLKQLGDLKIPDNLKDIGSADSETAKKTLDSATNSVDSATKGLKNLFKKE